eukprot:scaffold38150_cov65-Phaeocystis_antarctica.AAC.17
MQGCTSGDALDACALLTAPARRACRAAAPPRRAAAAAVRRKCLRETPRNRRLRPGPRGRTAASHWAVSGATYWTVSGVVARPECVAQPRARRASPKRSRVVMLWHHQDGHFTACCCTGGLSPANSSRLGITSISSTTPRATTPRGSAPPPAAAPPAAAVSAVAVGRRTMSGTRVSASKSVCLLHAPCSPSFHPWSDASSTIVLSHWAAEARAACSSRPTYRYR